MKIKLLLILVFFFIASPISAIVLNPSSGAYSPGTETNITIIAAPPTSNDVVARVNLHLTNATVVSFTSTFNAFGTCEPDGDTDNVTDLCVDLTKLGGDEIASGEQLGVLRVRWGSVGTSSIIRVAGNGYYDSELLREQLGVAGTYTITTSTSRLPSTSLEINDLFIFTTGLITIFVGFYLKKYIKYNSNEKK